MCVWRSLCRCVCDGAWLWYCLPYTRAGYCTIAQSSSMPIEYIELILRICVPQGMYTCETLIWPSGPFPSYVGFPSRLHQHITSIQASIHTYTPALYIYYLYTFLLYSVTCHSYPEISRVSSDPLPLRRFPPSQKVFMSYPYPLFTTLGPSHTHIGLKKGLGRCLEGICTTFGT